MPIVLNIILYFYILQKLTNGNQLVISENEVKSLFEFEYFNLRERIFSLFSNTNLF